VYVEVTLKDGSGRVLGMMVASEKQFKTGSRGFYANGKVEFDGKRYQTQIQLVEIGSKGATEAPSEAPST
jgi:hypothetical protein